LARDRPSSPFTPTLRVLLGLLGAGSFGTGVIAVFVTENGTGTGVLLIMGGALLVLALLGNRVESLELGGASLKLRAAAADRYALADESEGRGDLDAAERLRAEAHALMDTARPIASDYRSVRSSMPSGRERTHAMERVVERARRLATQESFEPAEVQRWLREGTDEERITALAMMQARGDYRDFGAVLSAIEYSRSAFEQYHAMLLAAEMIADLEATQLRKLSDTVKAQRDWRLRRDSGRWRLSEEILRRADERPAAR
jgi:hypothetical protein